MPEEQQQRKEGNRPPREGGGRGPQGGRAATVPAADRPGGGDAVEIAAIAAVRRGGFDRGRPSKGRPRSNWKS